MVDKKNLVKWLQSYAYELYDEGAEESVFWELSNAVDEIIREKQYWKSRANERGLEAEKYGHRNRGLHDELHKKLRKEFKPAWQEGETLMLTDKQWPSLKKALWQVITDEKLNTKYVNAWDLTEKLYQAALTAAEQAEPAPAATRDAAKKLAKAMWGVDLVETSPSAPCEHPVWGQDNDGTRVCAKCGLVEHPADRSGAVKVKQLDEDDYEEIINAAAIKMRKATSGVRGQVITVQDSLDWWVMKETEHRILAALEPAEPATDAEPVATILSPDPYDERDGPYFSNEDLKRLSRLPSGTKLYTSPQSEKRLMVLRDAIIERDKKIKSLELEVERWMEACDGG